MYVTTNTEIVFGCSVVNDEQYLTTTDFSLVAPDILYIRIRPAKGENQEQPELSPQLMNTLDTIQGCLPNR